MLRQKEEAVLSCDGKESHMNDSTHFRLAKNKGATRCARMVADVVPGHVFNYVRQRWLSVVDSHLLYENNSTMRSTGTQLVICIVYNNMIFIQIVRGRQTCRRTSAEGC